MQRNVVILDIDYVTYENKPVIRLFSKDGDKNIILLDDTFEPYLYVMADDLDKCIDEIQNNFDVVCIEKVNKKDFQIEKEFLKVTFNHPQELAKNRDALRDLESVVQIREFDIPFYRRYLMDRDVIPMTEVVAIGDKIDSFLDLDSNKQDIEIIKLTDELKRSPDYPREFRILSFDLEVRNPHGMPNSEIDEIIMIGVSSNFGINQVISTKTNSDCRDDFVNQMNSEKEMIEEFVKIIKENNIDIIVGYNSDNFDFPYLKDRAKILGIDLDIGMDGSDIRFIRRGYANAASFKGLIHVDLYLVMRRYMTLERYTLERVYYELFGEEKIDVPGDRIWEFWDNGGEELDNLFDYSLDDVVSTLKIAEQTLPLNLELTRIIGQPLFDVSRMATGQQAEWFLVKQAYFDNEVVPNKQGANFANRAAAEDNEGGYVREPEKGLHENLVQFDFRSLYPSIIISKNISPDVMYLGDVDNEEDYNISPEHGLKFKKEPQGFIPSVIDKILQERFRIKREMKASDDDTEKKALNVQQQAIKRLANTMYGIYGFPRFRWYSFECAKAITSWGRQYIKSSIKKAEEYGFYAIYADTDGFYAKYKKKDKRN
ncbi:DNA polymerase I [Methanobrevibacter gottschalkii]|uniref:DNA polymerase n=2 Tax=Methanobrevibacter gottschalkii TaxID=190974 RepID=A0A3N5B5N5_9EURY|nr:MULTISPECIES: DNA-directed DNA polymerase [Methanobrevibacter]MCQ2970158.1 DNA-directed DNA polymerase [archaeon]OEC93803.1 DNA polymerase [Methanobrevibacter sp. A27]RPF52643.1 DNA polymerase I [Methanobrevibacter gottschalkii DSM 11977]SEK29992.1 DNA polymerase I [Methanobrevibacter gottschalkii]